MEFDIKKTIELTKGGLLDRQNTWQSYLAGNPTWMQTATVLTGPLLLANVVLTVIFSRMTGGYYSLGYGSNFFVALIMGVVMAVIGFAVGALVFSFLAGTFGGKQNFDRSFAAFSLASIPALLAGIVGALIPVVGIVISLAGGIASLVFLYQVMPLALDVPDAKRTVHFVASIITLIVINFIVGTTLGVGTMSRSMSNTGASNAPVSSTVGSGMLGEMARQGQLMEAAKGDTFDPPSDGMLTDSQVVKLIGTLKKTRAAQEQYAAKMNKLSEEMKDKEKASPADVARLYSGIGGALGANNAEMEVVKTAGGNWAEHVWVRNQLHIAMLQQGEGSKAIEHNYGLYQAHQEELDELL